MECTIILHHSAVLHISLLFLINTVCILFTLSATIDYGILFTVLFMAYCYILV